MKTFITSILNVLGFGVYGVVPEAEGAFINKLQEFAPDVHFTITKSNGNGFVIAANGKNDSFNIKYTYKEGTRVVKSIDVK